MTMPDIPVTVLITGSRNWPYRLIVEHALDVIRIHNASKPITVIHGGCPTGADMMAHHYAVRSGMRIDQHNARWSKHGRAAGPIRNREMVDLLSLSALPVCTAFMLDRSSGTRGTLELVQNRHIPWKLYGASSRNPGIVNYCDSLGRIASFPVTFTPEYVTESAE